MCSDNPAAAAKISPNALQMDVIRAEVARLCRDMGRGGGYILSGSKSLQPETPTENAAAVVESFLEQAGVAIPFAPF